MKAFDDADWDAVEVDGHVIALVTGCDCEAPDPEECPCLDAAWFVRVDTPAQVKAWLDEKAGEEEAR